MECNELLPLNDFDVDRLFLLLVVLLPLDVIDNGGETDVLLDCDDDLFMYLFPLFAFELLYRDPLLFRSFEKDKRLPCELPFPPEL